MVEKKNKTQRKIRLNWYFIFLIISIILFTTGIIFSYIVKETNSWLSNILVSISVSIMFGAILAAAFAWVSEKGLVVSNAHREMNNIFAFTYRCKYDFYIIAADSTIANLSKYIKMSSLMEQLPNIYDIGKLYPLYKKEYYQFKNELIKELNNDNKKNIEMNSQTIMKHHFKIAEIANITFIIQELFFQEYRGVSKEPIRPHLVFYNSKKSVDLGEKYSMKKRKFNKKAENEKRLLERRSIRISKRNERKNKKDKVSIKLKSEE